MPNQRKVSMIIGEIVVVNQYYGAAVIDKYTINVKSSVDGSSIFCDLTDISKKYCTSSDKRKMGVMEKRAVNLVTNISIFVSQLEFFQTLTCTSVCKNFYRKASVTSQMKRSSAREYYCSIPGYLKG